MHSTDIPLFSERTPYFYIFINLPSRDLKDYYQVIANPLSLKKLQKQVKGMQGRSGNTGVTEFKSWNQFEETASLLWTNARHYNEDGSEVYELANELEVSISASSHVLIYDY